MQLMNGTNLILRVTEMKDMTDFSCMAYTKGMDDMDALVDILDLMPHALNIFLGDIYLPTTLEDIPDVTSLPQVKLIDISANLSMDHEHEEYSRYQTCHGSTALHGT
jgi:hypothetical protein